MRWSPSELPPRANKLRPPGGGTSGGRRLACRKGGYRRRSKLSVSKHDATRAEYDRSGGVGISRGQAIKIPSKVLLPERPIHVLLMRAKCLRLGARSAFSPCFRIPTRGRAPAAATPPLFRSVVQGCSPGGATVGGCRKLCGLSSLVDSGALVPVLASVLLNGRHGW